ncbi:Holliday junction resolvase RecU [Anaerotignum sp.]|uniref:Holliday junction resolvase RecU n=1 Tax=Anaerotignum sp. TaxID=2039241 RepID=UPI0028AB550F|nr:Holliday junction resolvase RecU [Anaerotignum sp.]
MSHWNSRGLRGSSLEECINFANEKYRQRGLALLQKVPTPITPVRIDQEKRTITLAYFEKQSTVDYIGVAQGVPICFDAKETAHKNLPLQNIHEHQIEFMADFRSQRGLAFLLVHFTSYDEYYLLPFEILQEFWLKAEKGGRKSIPKDAFQNKYRIQKTGNGILHYLDAVSLYLNETDEEPRKDGE